MKIAVTYDNGNIFQHFGKTENFKVYEVEDNKVVSSEVIGSNGTGHGALAGRSTGGTCRGRRGTLLRSGRRCGCSS